MIPYQIPSPDAVDFVAADPQIRQYNEQTEPLGVQLRDAILAGDHDRAARLRCQLSELGRARATRRSDLESEFKSQLELEARTERIARRMMRRRARPVRVMVLRPVQARRQRRTRVVRTVSSAKSTADPEPASSSSADAPIGSSDLGGAA